MCVKVMEISNNGYQNPAAAAELLIAVESENGFINEEGQLSESVTNACNSTGPPPQDDDSSDTSLKLGLVFLISLVIIFLLNKIYLKNYRVN